MMLEDVLLEVMNEARDVLRDRAFGDIDGGDDGLVGTVVQMPLDCFEGDVGKLGLSVSG